MAALARTAARTGGGSLTIVYLDDPYGRGLAAALETAVESRPSLSLSSVVPFSGADPDLDDDALQIVETGSRIIAVLGDTADGARMLAAIDKALPNNLERSPPFVVVNDSLRDATDVIATISNRLREQITGVAARALVTTVDAPTGYFSTNAYDCVVLIALAARQAGTDAPRAIANQMASVSSGGRLCSTMQTAPRLSIKACRSTTTAGRVQLIYRQQAISAGHGFESSDLTNLVVSTSSTTWASKSRREWPPPADRMCSDQIFDWCEVAHEKVSELSVNRRALVESHGVHDIFDDLETDAEQRDTPLVESRPVDAVTSCTIFPAKARPLFPCSIIISVR